MACINETLLKIGTCILILLSGCESPPQRIGSDRIFLGQGIMAGNISSTSAILQTRLTKTDKPLGNYLQGAPGMVRFEWAKTSSFKNSQRSGWLPNSADSDFIVRTYLEDLEPGTSYFYRAWYGPAAESAVVGPTGLFQTMPGLTERKDVKFAFTSCLNYGKYTYPSTLGSKSAAAQDNHLGYRGLEAITHAKADYVIFNGDVVYYDNPQIPELTITTHRDMRSSFHRQLSMPRFKALLRQQGSFWLKDDHDYRTDDAYPQMDYPISHALGVKTFNEQVPTGIGEPYFTRRVSPDLQIWFLESREFRSPNPMEDTDKKTLWGKEQREWLQKTILQSDATYKVLISPTPMVGPDHAHKSDNHTNFGGYQSEGTSFFNWLVDKRFSPDAIFIVTGDRHWQYHSVHLTGYQEFSIGALDDSNARIGRRPGSKKSTDPKKLVRQPYAQNSADEVSGGFLVMSLQYDGMRPKLIFTHYNENGFELYRYASESKQIKP